MKIRGKINLIVGIMSLLAIAITGMSLLIVSEYNQRLGEYRTPPTGLSRASGSIAW